MDESEITKLLVSLGCDKIKTRNSGWVEASCPFAPYKHSKMRDAHPSFAISIVPGGTSRYRCFGCGSSGDMNTFIWSLERSSRRKFKDLGYFVERTNSPSMADLIRRLEFAESGEKTKVAGIVPSHLIKHVEELKILDEGILDGFSSTFPEDVYNWLTHDRGLTEDTLRQWEIGWHEKKSRISIPIRDCEEKLVGISGRAWPKERKPKYLHSEGFHRDYYLFGEYRVQKGKPAILVEGQFDAIKLHQFGYMNVFALLGSYISPMHIEKLAQWCPSVRIVPDGDEAGRKGAEVSAKNIEKKLPVAIVQVPDGPDPGDYDIDLARKLLGAPD